MINRKQRRAAASAQKRKSMTDEAAKPNGPQAPFLMPEALDLQYADHFAAGASPAGLVLAYGRLTPMVAQGQLLGFSPTFHGAHAIPITSVVELHRVLGDSIVAWEKSFGPIPSATPAQTAQEGQEAGQEQGADASKAAN